MPKAQPRAGPALRAAIIQLTILGCEHTLPTTKKECVSGRAAPSSAGEDTKVRDMFDEKLLDRMNFSELNQSLEYVIERIEKIEVVLSEGEDDSRLDTLCVIGNKIIMRMDAIVREYGRSHPEVLAQWKKAMDGYEERFAKYTDLFLQDDTLLDLKRPETS
jgi:hypothetical protein